MEMAILNVFSKNKSLKRNSVTRGENLDLTQGNINIPYTIKGIDTEDKEMKNFLFTLGCYEGEKVTVISVLADNYIINIKNARYSIDKELAKRILI